MNTNCAEIFTLPKVGETVYASFWTDDGYEAVPAIVTEIKPDEASRTVLHLNYLRPDGTASSDASAFPIKEFGNRVFNTESEAAKAAERAWVSTNRRQSRLSREN